MTTRTIRTKTDLDLLLRFLRDRKLPFTVEVQAGARRTTDQNRLQRLWLNEVAEQMGDRTAEEVRGYCKLTMGVPILRAQNENFAISYDRIVKPLPYEQKLAIMQEPLDLPVTRLMTTAQKTQYLDAVYRHFADQGLVLTLPERTA